MFRISAALVAGVVTLAVLFLIWPQPEATEIVPATATPPQKTESPAAVDIRDRLKGGLESFSLDGVGLPMSLEQFRRERPAAILYRLNPDLGQECLAIPLQPPGTLAIFDFVDGRLYEIEISYPTRQIEAVAKELIAILGPAVQDSEDQYNWMTTGRIAELEMKNGTLVFSVADPRLKPIYTRRRLKNLKAEEEARRKEQEQQELAQREAEQYRREHGYGLGMTTSGYLFLKNGMSKLDVDAVLGCFGEEQSRAGSLRVYAWEKGFAQVVATFRNDKLVSKSQFGL